METSFDSQQEIFLALPDRAKLIVDMLVYACTPVDRDFVENLFGPELFQVYKQLNRANIIYYWKYDDVDHCTSERAPKFTISRLLQQAKEGRDIEKEIGTPSFWEKTNRLGRPVRDRIIASFFDIQLPNYNGGPTFSYQELMKAAAEIKPSVDTRKTFSGKYLIRYFREVILLHTEQLSPDSLIDKWYKQFSDTYPNSPRFQTNLRDIHAISQLLLSGQIDEIPGKVDSNTQEGASLLGMYHLHHGEYDQANQYFLEGEIDKQGYDDHRASQYSLFSFGRAISSLLASPSGNFDETGFPYNNKYHSNIFEQLAQSIRSNKNQEEILSLFSSEDRFTPLSQYLLYALKRHFGLHTAGSLDFLAREASEIGWNLPLLVNHFASPIKTLAANIGGGADSPSEWEKTFISLETLAPEQKAIEIKISPLARARIVYFIQMTKNKHWEIVPILQTSKDGDTWTTGRRVAKEKLEDGSTPGMNDLDHKLANPHLSKEEKFILLANHPHVYLEKKNGPSHISIITGQPIIMILRDTTGYSLYTNFHAFLSEKEIIWDDFHQRIEIKRVSSYQFHVLRELNKINHLPFEARDHLLALQKHLQETISFDSNIIDDDNVKKTVQGDSRILVQIAHAFDVFRARLLVKPFPTIPLYCKAGEGASGVSTFVNGEKWLAARDLDKELENYRIVQSSVRTLANDQETGSSYLYTLPANGFQLVEFVNAHPEIATIEWPKGSRFSLWAIG